MPGVLEGKNIIVTGVLTQSSIAYHITKMAIQEGANIALTAPEKSRRLTEKTALKLDKNIEVIRFDATEESDEFVKQVAAIFPTVHGVVHCIAGSPLGGMGGNFMETSFEEASLAFEISAFSLKKIVKELLPILNPGASIVGLDFDATQVYPGYDWMGVSKSSLESIARYMALYLGDSQIRVNLVSAGPVNTFSTQNMTFFTEFIESWDKKAPLGWGGDRKHDIAKACVILLSDWLSSTTGEIIHVDGGYFINGL